MFNNLEDSNPSTPQAGPNIDNNPNQAPTSQSTPQVAPKQQTPTPHNLPIDDIFAETDKVDNHVPHASGRNAGDIETKKVGLISEKDKFVAENEPKSSRSLFKILVAVILVVIIGLGAYLAYAKFFSSSPTLDQNLNVNPAVNNTPIIPDAAKKIPEAPVTEPIVTSSTTTTGVTTPTEVATTTTTSIETDVPVFVPIIDSDDDGLTDDEEIIAGTNINIIDTDNDGVSDYEEVKIYKSNPLNADSDGDGYQDGQEIRSGYNPNGPGKLPGNIE